MERNKPIEREAKASTKIFDDRSLKTDYRTLEPILKKGMAVLDVGCGTGAITKDIAKNVGNAGKVIGIDNTEKFIQSGRESDKDIENVNLVHCDLFDFETKEKFDLIVSARTLQWLNNPKEALSKMKSMLKPNGMISILDYNHNNLEWKPEPPESMKAFYVIFLKWRKDAGMNNEIADDLPDLMKEIGMVEIEKINSDEHYDKSRPDFKAKVGIWAKVAGLKQMVDEGYLEENLRLKAIEEYNEWIEIEAISMTMKLNEVRGKIPASE
ncbi:class I SAM-dependent methyltransferase [Cyclobacterium sp. 1_MG-2023]|uniref:class I SAM-dependent methyltransferase n=1 Tax=Cyclobacterium sp. 1_MG-2023 TaxID=3062681 RepID=UPI0026E294A9|nr:class I SAM-dependent methyltransferase [Cyclobacterium sp. 1_MG-2023]MDO6436649.1 class I SAM-dependent methyltransferase [Cyclobacterium sp. 1_MG-2023]